jgi:succinylarginine dihydrolase
VASGSVIDELIHFDLRQSMRNGGGPACLRLRVALTDAEAAAMHQGVVMTETLYHTLVAWVEKHYRDRWSLPIWPIRNWQSKCIRRWKN